MERVKPDTAGQYLKALRSLHIERGYDPVVFSDPRISLLMRGGRRLYGNGDRRKRLPLTLDILTRILHEVDNDYNGTNLRAALCVAFAAFLRAGEFTWDDWDPNSSPKFLLARSHITFLPDGNASLFLPSSKTDPARKGTTIHLATVPSWACPVTALHCLFRLCPAPLDSPLFSRLFGPFSRSYLVERIHHLLLWAGLPTTGFSGHSIRKGAAVTAWRHGITKDEIKLMGRWKSDAVVLYIDEAAETECTQRLLTLNSRLLSSQALLEPDGPLFHRVT